MPAFGDTRDRYFGFAFSRNSPFHLRFSSNKIPDFSALVGTRYVLGLWIENLKISRSPISLALASFVGVLFSAAIYRCLFDSPLQISGTMVVAAAAVFSAYIFQTDIDSAIGSFARSVKRSSRIFVRRRR